MTVPTSPTPQPGAVAQATPVEPGALDARAVGIMTVLCLVWALQQITLKATAGQISPMLMVGLRSLLALLLLLALMRHRGVTPRPGHWRPGLVVGALFAVEFLLVAEALRMTHASHVVVFLYTAPIFAALGLHARLPAERLGALQWTGIALAFAGISVAFLGGGGGPASADASQVLLGDALALLGGAAWGATTVAIRVSALASAPAMETLMYQLTGAFVLLLPAAWLTGQWHMEPTPAVWANLAFHSVVVCFASFLTWFWMLRRYLASRLGVFSFLTPLFGVLLGVWLLGESLTAAFVAGSVLVLAGIGLVGGHAALARRLGASRRRAGPKGGA